jgi:diguanylate cyclase (GGDEF)-like protein/PAS domain S-box-containing protein
MSEVWNRGRRFVSVDDLPDAVIVIDREARLRWANKRAEDLFGRSLDESVGLDAMDFVHPDDLGIAAVSISSVTNKDVGTPLELRVRAADGWRTAEVIGTPMGDEVLLTLRDLTQRRRWEVAGDHMARFRVILQNAAPPTFLLDRRGVVRSSSAALTRSFGIDQEDLEDRPLAGIIVDEDREVFETAFRKLSSHREGDELRTDLDVRIAGARGTVFPVSLTLANLLDDPTVEGVVATMHDVGRRVRAEDGLREANSLLETTLDATVEGVLAVDLDGRITSFNKRFLELWHIPEEVVSSGSDQLSLEYAVRALVDPDAFLERVEELYADPEAESHDLIEFLDGRVFERDSRPQKLGSETIGRVWSFRDVTATRALQNELARQASQDSLTGLANQKLFRQLVGESLSAMSSASDRIAVLFIDLDAFKNLNDSLGHSAGDEMLVNVASRLGLCVRSHDSVARLGGDEFAVLLNAIDDRVEVEEIARRILNTLADPIQISGRPMGTSASIGIAYGRPGDTADNLLRNADLAMYVAKNEGRNRFRAYQSEMHLEALRRLEVESGLRGAALRGELEVHYQPIVRTATGSVAAFEALVRWAHPEQGLLGPAAFIPEAEQSDLIHEIGRHVLSVACKQLAQWRGNCAERPMPSITVNVSPRQLLDDPGLVGFVSDLLADCGLGPSALVLEMTETALVDDPDSAARTLEELTSLGVRLALDDFGTGHSSLSHLRRFPIDSLKIDREFIAEVESKRERSMVMAISQLAHSLGKSVVAEGVETEAQRAVLVDIGCDLAQGYLFARPLTESAATAYLLDRITAS